MAIPLPLYRALPPFYVLQPVLRTRERQIQLWCELLLLAAASRLQRATAATGATMLSSSGPPRIPSPAPLAFTLHTKSAVFQVPGSLVAASGGRSAAQAASGGPRFVFPGVSLVLNCLRDAEGSHRVLSSGRDVDDNNTSVILLGVDASVLASRLAAWARTQPSPTGTTIHTVTELLQEGVLRFEGHGAASASASPSPLTAHGATTYTADDDVVADRLLADCEAMLEPCSDEVLLRALLADPALASLHGGVLFVDADDDEEDPLASEEDVDNCGRQLALPQGVKFHVRC